MIKDRVKATKLRIGLPFNLGTLELEPDEVEQQAAWELYVELSTRVSTQPIQLDEGLIQESLESLYTIFSVTRDILKRAGPSVAKGPDSFGDIAIKVLNEGIRPFLNKWHPRLSVYEDRGDSQYSSFDPPHAEEYYNELAVLQTELEQYIEALAQISGIRQE
jgi:hypothetical protein